MGDLAGTTEQLGAMATDGAVAPPNRVGEWMARTRMLNKRQRAFGTEASLRQWTTSRGLQLRESPLPA